MSNCDLLTEKEVEREYPKLRVKTLQTWRLLKRGPRFARIGRRVFYPRAAIEQFIQASMVETGREPELAR